MTLVIDTPQGIEAYRLIATRTGLKLEIDMQEKYGFPPTGSPTRGMALASAKRILIAAGRVDPRGRLTRKRAYTLLCELLQEQGYGEN